MGSIHFEGATNQAPPSNGQFGIESMGQTNGDSFRSFKIAGLESALAVSPTGMKDEILLLSWLIVLLRTREDRQVSFSWCYKTQGNGAEGESVVRSLSVDQVVAGEQSTVGQIAVAVSHHIFPAAQTPCAVTPGVASLLLSTGSLSQTPEGAEHEVSPYEISNDGLRLDANYHL